MSDTPNLMVDFSAQEPLGHHKAIEKAIELRNRGPMWTWRVIADVMSLYHGFTRTPGWYQMNLRGRVEPRTRNRHVPQRWP